MKPTLHLLGIPHTISFDDRYTHCAFTTKVNRFAPMMRSVGYDVIHYGNSSAPAGTCLIKKGSFEYSVAHVPIFFPDELMTYTGTYNPSSPNFVGEGSYGTLYADFNKKLRKELLPRLSEGDMVCLPFGWAHNLAVDGLKGVFLVETGIGYEDVMPNTFKIFESSAWMHYHCGKRKQRLNDNRGNDYEWVIPNYFDLSEWEMNTGPGEYVLYYGRIAECKGLDVVKEIAKHRPDLKFVICGQGDAAPWLLPNIEYRPPVHGKARSELLGKAIAVLCPSRYVEPFGGVAVEAMLCGRPVLASHFGAFSETLLRGACHQCRTLSDWLCALDMCAKRDHPAMHKVIRYNAERFDMFRLANDYDAAFRQIYQLTRNGWYAIDNRYEMV